MSHYANDQTLRHALTSNAVISLTCGLILTFFASKLTQLLFANKFTLFGLNDTTIVTAVGIGLALFAGLIFFAISRAPLAARMVYFITAQDIGWVLGCSMIAFCFAHAFSSTGYLLFIAQTVMIGLIAVWQLIGLQKMKPQTGE